MIVDKQEDFAVQRQGMPCLRVACRAGDMGLSDYQIPTCCGNQLHRLPFKLQSCCLLDYILSIDRSEQGEREGGGRRGHAMVCLVDRGCACLVVPGAVDLDAG
jgi:hypothetical protein